MLFCWQKSSLYLANSRVYLTVWALGTQVMNCFLLPLCFAFLLYNCSDTFSSAHFGFSPLNIIYPFSWFVFSPPPTNTMEKPSFWSATISWKLRCSRLTLVEIPQTNAPITAFKLFNPWYYTTGQKPMAGEDKCPQVEAAVVMELTGHSQTAF